MQSPCPGRIGLRDDGTISIVEALYLAQLFDPDTYDAGLENIRRLLGRPPTELDMGRWDMDGDGVLTINDAQMLADYLGRRIDTIPACSLELVPVAIPPRPPEKPSGKRRTAPLLAILGTFGLLGTAALLGSTRRSL